MRCAAASRSSFANVLGISKSNFLGQSLLGNDLSTITNIALGPALSDKLHGESLNQIVAVKRIDRGARTGGFVDSSAEEVVFEANWEHPLVTDVVGTQHQVYRHSGW